MLSAVKNFALTFVISLLVFAICAYSVVGYVLTNLSGITGNTVDTTAETTAPDPVVTDSHGDIIDITLPDTGTSFNLLLALTDYDPAIYEYDPDVIELVMGDPGSGNNTAGGSGVETTAPLPDDLPNPRPITVTPDADPEDISDSTATGDPIIPGGFYSAKYQKLRTTSLLLLRFDRERSEVTYTALPDDAMTVMDGKYISLGDVYATYGRDVLCDAVHAMTGCFVDGYMILHPESFISLIDALGGVSFNVPCEMDFGSLVIKAGMQTLNGTTAARMLGFGLYLESGQSRENTAAEFTKAVVEKLTSITNYPSAQTLFETIVSHVDTNYGIEKLLDNKDFIFRYSQLAVSTRDIVTVNTTISSKVVRVVDTKSTLQRFENMRRILPEDTASR